MFEVSGAEFRTIAQKVAAKDSRLLLEGADPAGASLERRYRVAMPVNVLWAMAPLVKPAPGSYWLTGGDTGDAVEQFLAGD